MSDDCGCYYWIIRPDCADCVEPEGCPVESTQYVATDEQPSQPIPVGVEFIANVASDYSALNPDAVAIGVGETFFSTIPNIQFPSGSQVAFDITSLARVARGTLPFLFCNDPVNGSCCSSEEFESFCSQLTDKLCPPPAPCDIPICKEALCCLSDACKAGSVSAIPTAELPVGTIIWVWLCAEERFVKLVLEPGLPYVKRPVCGNIVRNGCELEVQNSSGIGTLHYQWYQGRTGDVRCPAGADLPTFTPTEHNAYYWVRVRDDCSFCDSQDFFYPNTLVIGPITGCPLSILPIIASEGTTTYQWYQGADDSNPVAGETGPTLDVIGLALPIPNYFWVRVSDDCMTADSQRVYLTPPEIISFNPIPIEDTTPQIEVIADGFGNPVTYQWYRGLSGDTGDPLVGETASTLQIAGNLDPVYEIYENDEAVPAGFLVKVLVDGDYTSIGGGAGEVAGNTFVSTGGMLPPPSPILRVEYKNSNYWVRVTAGCAFVDSPNTEVAPALGDHHLAYGTIYNKIPEISGHQIGYGTVLNATPEASGHQLGYGISFNAIPEISGMLLAYGVVHNPIVLSTPTWVSASNNAPDTDLTWNVLPETDVIGYRIYYSPAPGVTVNDFLEEVYGRTTVNYTHPTTLSGYYRIAAVDAGLNLSSLSLELQAT